MNWNEKRKRTVKKAWKIISGRTNCKDGVHMLVAGGETSCT